jgi:hypothetical protein
MRKAAYLFVVAVIAMGLSVQGQTVPLKINYQGVVREAGQLITGNGEFRFAVLDNGTPQKILWSNDGSKNGLEATAANVPTNPVTLAVKEGIYSVTLGDATLTNMTEISVPVFRDNSQTFLRVWFNKPGGTAELMQPDVQLVSVPYAYRAGSADLVTPANIGRDNTVRSIYFDEDIGLSNKVVYTVPSGKTFVLTDVYVTFSEIGPQWEFRNRNSALDQYLKLMIDARTAGLTNYLLQFNAGIAFEDGDVIAIRQTTTGDLRRMVAVLSGFEF